MRSTITAILAVAAGLVVANMLGVAAAEAPTVTPVRTVSVEGVATVAIAQDANLATATSVYREGMANALTDGQGKAEFLVGKVAGTLGSVQSIVEDGGSISCKGGEAEESRYVEYEGEQPDFGSRRSVAIAPIAAAAPRTARVTHRKKANKHPVAKKASAATCTLEAQVSLIYAID